jgi:hypothetical protein
MDERLSFALKLDMLQAGEEVKQGVECLQRHVLLRQSPAGAKTAGKIATGRRLNLKKSHFAGHVLPFP